MQNWVDAGLGGCRIGYIDKIGYRQDWVDAGFGGCRIGCMHIL